MKRIKLVLILACSFSVICLALAFFSFFYNHSEIKWVDSEIYLIAPDEDFCCREVPFDLSTGLYIALIYRPFYNYSLGIFNGFTIQSDLKKEKITSISVKLLKTDMSEYDLTNSLHCYIDAQYFADFVQKLYSASHTEENFDIDIYNYIYDLAIKVKDVSEFMPLVLKTDHNAQQYLPKNLFEGIKIEILDCTPDMTGKPRKAFCANMDTDKIFPTEKSYVGNLDYFKAMYNINALNPHDLDLTYSMMFKLDLKQKIKLKNFENIVFEVHFEDGTSIQCNKYINQK